MASNNKVTISNLSIFVELIKQQNLFLTNLKRNYIDITRFCSHSIIISNLDISFFIINNVESKVVDNLTREEFFIKTEDIKKILATRNADNFKKYKLFFTFKLINLTQLKILLNASGNTNFIFQIDNLDSSKIDEINAINSATKLKDRLEAIENYGGQFSYIGAEKDTMTHNLKMVDSLMPEIIADVLLAFYKHRISSMSKIVDFIHSQGKLNQKINYGDKLLLQNKIEKLLVDVLLGFFAGSKWNGHYEANGSMVLKNTGDCVAFHVIDLKTLRAYLYNTIKLDTPSTTRHRFGQLYLEKNNKLYFKLNLQLRC